MPQNTTIALPQRVWTQLTDANVTAITFQNLGATAEIFVKATANTTAPTDQTGAMRYGPGQGERNVLLADLFPGVTGAARLWAYAPSGVSVLVSHA
jgi:hypothetical protein